MVDGLVANARRLLREHHQVRTSTSHHRFNEGTDRDDRSWLQSVTGKMKGKPLLDLVGSVVEDYGYLWDNYYFSTATL